MVAGKGGLPSSALTQANEDGKQLLFGLPVIMDTADPSIAVGETLLLQYQVTVIILRLCAWE